ncbi:MAG: HDOD domain-containing protein [Epsilonproteobacteria bacterium]|nr:HDOD domain-containing protein [Campylobacterota bacterium]
MVTNEEIAHYIHSIPPAPTIIQETIQFVRNGDLVKAAKCADEDPALKLYLRTLVNRAVYGFRNEVHDVSQIFGILGISTAQQVLYHYLMTLLAPKKWKLFHLDNHTFYDLQASLSRNWGKILHHLGVLDHDTASAITLLPASIIICDALFGSHKSEVEQLRSVKALDYNTILSRLSGQSLFDLSSQIAEKWEIPSTISRIVHAASGLDRDLSENEHVLAQWMHLLLFFELSKGIYVQAGLNEFIDFQIDFVSDIYESFVQVMEYNESNR